MRFDLCVLAVAILVVPSVCLGEGDYKWAPERFSKPMGLDVMQYFTLRLTAEQNCETALSSKLIQTSFVAHAFAESLLIIVDTECQPDWDHYMGQGRFDVSDRELKATYTRAAVNVQKVIRSYLGPEIDEQAIVTRFLIRGLVVGTWRKGLFKLESE